MSCCLNSGAQLEGSLEISRACILRMGCIAMSAASPDGLSLSPCAAHYGLHECSCARLLVLIAVVTSTFCISVSHAYQEPYRLRVAETVQILFQRRRWQDDDPHHRRGFRLPEWIFRLHRQARHYSTHRQVREGFWDSTTAPRHPPHPAPCHFYSLH